MSMQEQLPDIENDRGSTEPSLPFRELYLADRHRRACASIGLD